MYAYAAASKSPRRKQSGVPLLTDSSSRLYWDIAVRHTHVARTPHRFPPSRSLTHTHTCVLSLPCDRCVPIYTCACTLSLSLRDFSGGLWAASRTGRPAMMRSVAVGRTGERERRITHERVGEEARAAPRTRKSLPGCSAWAPLLWGHALLQI